MYARGATKFGPCLECTNQSCRAVVRPTAFTPLYRTALTYVQYQKLAYLYALGLRVDQTVHVVGLTYKVVEKCFHAFAVVTAWAEFQEGRSLRIDEGEGEADGAKFGVLGKGKPTSEHVGRMLAVASRHTGAQVLMPLSARSVPTGRNPGPESFDEVHTKLKRTFKDGSILVTDGAQAFKKHARVLKRPAAFACNHTRGQFSRFGKVALNVLSRKTQENAKKRSSTSRSSMRVTVSTNMVEGYIGNVKKQMARKGLLGGGAARNATVNALASSWLLKHSGLKALGCAMRGYISAHVDKKKPGAFWVTAFVADE